MAKPVVQRGKRTVFVAYQVPLLDSIAKRGVSEIRVYATRQAAEAWAYEPKWTEAAFRMSSGPYRVVIECEVHGA